MRDVWIGSCGEYGLLCTECSGWGIYNVHTYATGKSAFHIDKSFALRFMGNDVDSYGASTIYGSGTHNVDAVYIRLSPQRAAIITNNIININNYELVFSKV